MCKVQAVSRDGTWERDVLVSINNVVDWLSIVGVGDSEEVQSLVGSGWERGRGVWIGFTSFNLDIKVSVSAHNLQFKNFVSGWHSERELVGDRFLDGQRDVVSGVQVIIIVIRRESNSVTTINCQFSLTRSQIVFLEGFLLDLDGSIPNAIQRITNHMSLYHCLQVTW